MFEEFNHFFQDDTNDIYVEYTSSKQRNRQKKFLKEKHFVPDKDNPKTGMIDSTEIDPKTGKPIRVKFSFDNEMFNHDADAQGTDRIHMNERELQKHPSISRSTFAHEDGHLILNRDPNKAAAAVEKITKEIQKSDIGKLMNDHGNNTDEYIADRNSLYKVGYNETVRMLKHLQNTYLPKEYKTQRDSINKNPYKYILSKIDQKHLKNLPKEALILVGIGSSEKMYEIGIKNCEDRIKKEIAFKRELVREKLYNDDVGQFIDSHIERYKNEIIYYKNKIAESKKYRRELHDKFVNSLKATYTDEEKLKKELLDGIDMVEKQNRVEIDFRIKMLSFWNKDKHVAESYGPEEDDTSGTSEFDESYNNDPDDCYCESFDLDTSDTIQESYTDTKSVSILYKRWSTKNGEQYKPIAKFWDIVEKHVNASKLQGYGTDWTGYGTDFLYGIIFKNGNIPKEVIDDVKKAFPDMIVDNSFSIPSSFEETYSGDTENIDSLYDKIWSKGFLLHELEEFTDDGKCTIRVSYKNKVSQESTIPRSNEVYTNGGDIEKINDFPFDKVYFGSPNKLPTTMELDGPLFISPYPGIASIFSVRPQNLQKYGVPKGVRCNRDYDEWNKSLKDTVLQKPLTELHVRIQAENIKIKPTTELVSGYLYTIDVTPEIRDHIYQSSKMSKVFEFCIDKMDSVTFSNIKKINVRMTVTGESGYIQEAKLPTSKRNKLPDSDFALVYTDANGKKIRKYPVYDKAHVEAAARMFPRGIPLKYQKQVAKRILREAHSYDIDTSEWKLNKYK